MRMDGREEGREEREVSWEKTPFGKEVSLLLLREWREWECDDEWNEMRMERDWRLILLSKMSGGREVSWLLWRVLSETRKGTKDNGEKRNKDFWDWRRLIDGVIPMSLIESPLWCGMEMKMKRDWRRIWEMWGHRRHQMEWRWVCWNEKTWEIEWESVDVKWWLSVKSRLDRLVSSLKTPEGREVMELEPKDQMWLKEEKRRKNGN